MSTIRVLYVEDDTRQREALAADLAAAGFAVESAAAGEEGLRCLARGEHHVVLCDLNMPGLTGLDVLARVRAHDPQLPVIIITADRSVHTGVEAIRKGAFHFVVKPFSVDEVAAILRQAVEHAATRRRLARSESLLNNLFETVPDVIYSLDPSGAFLSISPAVKRTLGYDPEAMLGTSVFEIIHPEDRPRVASSFRDSIANHDDQVKTLQFRMIAADGDVRTCEISRRVVFEGDTPVRSDGIARDISDRQRLKAALLERSASLEQANAELSRGKDLLQAIFDAAQGAIVMAGCEGAIDQFNRIACEMFAVPAGELSQLSLAAFLERIAPSFADPTAFRRLAEQLRREPDDKAALTQMQHAEVFRRMLELRGDPRRWIALFCIPVSDAEQRPLGQMWVFSDHTKLKQADEQLHKIVDMSPVPLIVTRVEDGEILFANEPLGALVGIPPEALVGRTSPDFYADPQDRGSVLELLRQQGFVRDHEVRLRRANGWPFWATLSLALADLGGQPVLIGAVNDIDQRKEMEDALRWERNFVSAVLDTAGALVIVLDTEGRIIRFNQACQDTTGYSFDEVKGRPFTSIVIPPEDIDRVEDVFAEIRGGVDVPRYENRWLTKDGEHRLISWSNTTLTSASGEVEFVIATGIDITELRHVLEDLERTNRELKDAQTQLVQSEKMASLGMLVAGIAHEINTPVGAINSVHNTLVRSTEKLRAVLENDFAEQFAANRKLQLVLKALESSNQVIESGVSRVTNIVKRLKSFARLDEAELKSVDLHEGIEDTLTIIHHEVKHRATVERDYGELPDVPCFPGPLNQVFLNLFINAVQAIADKGTITVRTRHRAGEVVVTISDDGAGIGPETIKRIFDPGFTTKGVGVGTGLGLSICYQIMQDHRGRIEVESTPGAGATFSVIIPDNLDKLLGISL